MLRVKDVAGDKEGQRVGKKVYRQGERDREGEQRLKIDQI
jgi:hypothetical protein